MIYEYIFAFKFLMYCWQSGAVDAMTVATLVANIGSQYVGIVGGSLTEIKSIKQLPSVAIKPIQGLFISYAWIRDAGGNSVLRHQRIATIASLLSTSSTLGGMSSATTNAGYGGVIWSHISHMEDVLKTRGGATHVLMQAAQIIEHKMQKAVNLKNYKIVVDGQITSREFLRHFQQYEATMTSRQIIQNMFSEHTLRRCGKLSNFNYGEVSKTLPPIFFISKLPKTPLNISGVIVWSSFGIGSVIALSLGSLFLFQCWKRRRCLRENLPKDQVIIDVSHIDVID